MTSFFKKIKIFFDEHKLRNRRLPKTIVGGRAQFEHVLPIQDTNIIQFSEQQPFSDLKESINNVAETPHIETKATNKNDFDNFEVVVNTLNSASIPNCNTNLLSTTSYQVYSNIKHVTNNLIFVYF